MARRQFLFLTILCLRLASTALPKPTSGIIFEKEKIIATVVDRTTIEIQGHYWFFNSTQNTSSAAIFYPFPDDNHAGFPHFIALERIGTGELLSYKKNNGGISWELRLTARHRDSLMVRYRQRVERCSARYIVTTALDWNNPLKSAEFIIKISPGIIMEFCSYTTDTVYLKNDTTVYHARRSPFKPEVDLFLRWTCP